MLKLWSEHPDLYSGCFGCADLEAVAVCHSHHPWAAPLSWCTRPSHPEWGWHRRDARCRDESRWSQRRRLVEIGLWGTWGGAPPDSYRSGGGSGDSGGMARCQTGCCLEGVWEGRGEDVDEEENSVWQQEICREASAFDFVKSNVEEMQIIKWHKQMTDYGFIASCGDDCFSVFFTNWRNAKSFENNKLELQSKFGHLKQNWVLIYARYSTLPFLKCKKIMLLSCTLVLILFFDCVDLFAQMFLPFLYFWIQFILWFCIVPIFIESWFLKFCLFTSDAYFHTLGPSVSQFLSCLCHILQNWRWNYLESWSQIRFNQNTAFCNHPITKCAIFLWP